MKDGLLKYRAVEYLLSSVIASESDSVPINTIFDLVSVEDMVPEYRALYSILRTAWAKYRVIEPVALAGQISAAYSDEKNRNAVLRQFNGLWGLCVTNALWEHYLKLTLVDIKCSKVERLGKSVSVGDPKGIDEVIESIRHQINEISSRYTVRKTRDLGTICNEYLANMDNIIQNGTPDTIRTGFDYEHYIKGFRPGDYIILAGRPKMGKSAVANALIVKALQQGKRVMVVNNEMDETSCVNRLISNIGGVNCEALQEPDKMTDQQVADAMQAAEVLQSYKLNLYCMRFKTAQEILTESKRLAEIGQPIDWLVIDYLQLLQASDKERRKSRYDEVSYISWELKMLANDMKVPVLALSQLNRQLEQRTNKRPIPADLKDSGSLEQDATAVMFIYRDEIYDPNSDDIGIAELNVSINRNGKAGVSYIALDFDYMDIHNIDRSFENN